MVNYVTDDHVMSVLHVHVSSIAPGKGSKAQPRVEIHGSNKENATHMYAQRLHLTGLLLTSMQHC
jgi:hypothetical protein